MALAKVTVGSDGFRAGVEDAGCLRPLLFVLRALPTRGFALGG